jgi:hypothetical protein
MDESYLIDYGLLADQVAPLVIERNVLWPATDTVTLFESRYSMFKPITTRI